MPFDWGEKLFDVVVGVVPGGAKLLPQHWRRQAIERLHDFNPFAEISANEDLLRALRLAWIEAAMKIDDAAASQVQAGGWPTQAREIRRFATLLRKRLRHLRHDACNRLRHPGNTAIDIHLQEVLIKVPDYIRAAGGPRVGEVITRGFAPTLSALTGWSIAEVPAVYPQLGNVGLLLSEAADARPFGELVFAAFAEIIKSPDRYPEAGAAFAAAMSGMARELAVQTLDGVRGIDEKLDRVLELLEQQQGLVGLAESVGKIEAELRRLLLEMQATAGTLRTPARAQDGSDAFVWPVARNFEVYMTSHRERFTGRVWLTEQVLAWLRGGEDQGLLILAPPGVGKSAFMASLVGTFEKEGIDTAFHFCRFDEQDDLRPGNIVRSLAAQLRTCVSGYEAIVQGDASARNALKCAETAPAAAWNSAIVGPLVALGEARQDKSLVLLIDGLDESLELHRAGSEEGGSLLEMVVRGVNRRLPRWVRIAISSREVEQLSGPMAFFRKLEILADGGHENRKDLEAFIRGRAASGRLQQLISEARMDETAFAQAVGDLCQDMFLLAHYLTTDAEAGLFNSADLHRVLARSRQISGMDAYYERVFSERLERAKLDKTKAKAVLGVVAKALGPLPERALAGVLADEGISEEDVARIIKAFGGLLRQDSRGGIRFDHFSIEQWLDPTWPEGRTASGRPKAGPYAIDSDRSMERLQAHCKRSLGLPFETLARRGFARYLEKAGVVHLADAGELASALALLMSLPLEKPARQPLRPATLPRRLENRVIDAIDKALSDFDKALRDFDRVDHQAAQTLAEMDAAGLHRLLRHRDYETGKYQPIIRALIQFKPVDWPGIEAQSLKDLENDLVFRNDIGVAYAEAWYSSQGETKTGLLARIETMARNEGRPEEREIAGYALKHICQKSDPQPWWKQIETTIRELAALYALRPDAVDRMVAGEMLLALTLQRVSVRDWLAGREGEDRFWRPYWPNLRMDIEAICVHAGHPTGWPEPLDHDTQASLESARAQRQRAEDLGKDLVKHALIVERGEKEDPVEGKPERNLSRLRWALGSLADQQCDKVALHDALEDLAVFVDRKDCHDLITNVLCRLLLHPSWDLTEAGGSLLADLIKRKGRISGPWWLFERLLQSDPLHWRQLHGAVDAAFNVGGVDEFRMFRQVVVKLGRLPLCRVRGICVDNLRMWIKQATDIRKFEILADDGVRELLQLWLREADDIWLLEYLHLIFSELWSGTGGEPMRALVKGLMPADLKHYLTLDPQCPFYEQGAEDFLSAVERQRASEWPPLH